MTQHLSENAPAIPSQNLEAEESAITNEVEKNTIHNAAKESNEPVLAETDSNVKKWTNGTGFFTQIIVQLWFLGVILIGCSHIFSHIRFRRKLSYLLTDRDETIHVVDDMGTYKSKATIKTIAANVSPFVIGLFHPIIVIPSALQTEKLRPIVLHELTHVKRKDLIYALFLQCIKTVHFFNPLVYIFTNEVKLLMELSCDEKVSKRLTWEEKKDYSISILSMMSGTSEISQNALCLSESATNTKERLRVIMKNSATAKATKILSITLVLVLLFTSTAFSAVVNDQNPTKDSYVVNKLNDMDYFTYRDSDPENDGLTGRGEGPREIILVNSPFYKSFYAKIEMSSYIQGEKEYDDDGDLAKDTTEKQNVTAEIRMDSVEKVLNSGKAWTGKFTVSIDGNIVLDNATGCIEDIPSNKKSVTFSKLEIYDKASHQTVLLGDMNFNLTGEDMVNAIYEKQKTKRDLSEETHTKKTRIYDIAKVMDNGQEKKPAPAHFGYTIMYNGYNSKAEFNIAVPIENDNQISIQTDYQESYQCTEDTIKGNFFVYGGSKLIDEFYGTVTGLSGKPADTVQIISEDKQYAFAFLISENEESIRYIDEESQRYKGSSAFINTSEQHRYEIQLSMLPFTFALNKERTGVTVKLKEGLNYDGWASIMATYNSSDLDNIWEEASSKNNGDQWKFSVLNNGTTHLIQFEAYKKEPYIHVDQYEVFFEIIDNELFYLECSLDTLGNKNYSGDNGKALLFDSLGSRNLVRILSK